MIIKTAFLALFGLAAGSVTASGLFALISSIGLVNRYADVTDSRRFIRLYEDCIIAGSTFGNLSFIFNRTFSLGRAGCILFGVLSGIFIGTFLVCLAETVKGLPIFSKRVMMGRGLGFAILFLAAGKMVGQLMYYLYLYR